LVGGALVTPVFQLATLADFTNWKVGGTYLCRMNEKIKSEGKCLYCGQLCDKRSISKHLEKHLAELSAKTEGEEVMHLRVEGGLHFLQLLMPASAPLKSLDQFLRDIWLECCGHLSAFRLSGYVQVGMQRKVGDVFRSVEKLNYEYDFGSTTELVVKHIGTHRLPPFPAKERVRLLSRNEPLAFMCEMCKKKPATHFCTIHNYNEPSLFCDDCTKKHKKVCPDAADYALMSVCNSPRSGICGYEGGSIDLERGGVYQLT